MQETLVQKNDVTLCGIMKAPFEYSHIEGYRAIFRTYIEVTRTSGTKDTIPVLVREDMIENEWKMGTFFIVQGQYWSYNHHIHDTERKSKLILSVRAERMQPSVVEAHANTIRLEGYLCRKPIYRITPLGREITDIMLAVNRECGKTSYIPCVTWGNNAMRASEFEIGDFLSLQGRIQSREYSKILPDGTEEIRTAYEVSVSYIRAEEKKSYQNVI